MLLDWIVKEEKNIAMGTVIALVLLELILMATRIYKYAPGQYIVDETGNGHYMETLFTYPNRQLYWFSMYEFDEGVGWWMEPDRRFTIEAARFPYAHFNTIDPEGYHISPDLDEASPQRLMILGDSITFGHGMNDSETFANLLGQQRYAVDNFGISDDSASSQEGVGCNLQMQQNTQGIFRLLHRESQNRNMQLHVYFIPPKEDVCPVEVSPSLQADRAIERQRVEQLKMFFEQEGIAYYDLEEILKSHCMQGEGYIYRGMFILAGKDMYAWHSTCNKHWRNENAGYCKSGNRCRWIYRPTALPGIA